MDTLKNILIVILGVFAISSFTANGQKELSNEEKNIELVKKLFKENKFNKVLIYRLGSGPLKNVKADKISFDDIYIIINYGDDKAYINSNKISHIEKDGKNLKLGLQ